MSHCSITPLCHCATVSLSYCLTGYLPIAPWSHCPVLPLFDCPPRCSIALPALPTSSSLNVPDDCVCYIDDVVIPVSWSTVEARNNKLYLDIQITETFHRYHMLTLPSQNYVGATPGILQLRYRAAACSDAGRRKKAVNQMIVQEWLPTLPSITVFTSQRTNPSPFSNGCHEWDTSM